MKRSMRLVVSGALAVLGVGGLLLLVAFLALERRGMEPPATLSSAERHVPRDEAQTEAAPTEEDPRVALELATERPSGTAGALEETPIEEILGDAGEDPGAVFYASRVREAIKEGNPVFARELIRQMKEAHAGSVLVEEAESLFGSKR